MFTPDDIKMFNEFEPDEPCKHRDVALFVQSEHGLACSCSCGAIFLGSYSSAPDWVLDAFREGRCVLMFHKGLLMLPHYHLPEGPQHN